MAFWNDGESEDEYDPTLYCGGYDVFLTYGGPIPPSEETCYPPNTSSSYGSGFDYDRPSYSSASAYGGGGEYGSGFEGGGGDGEYGSGYGRRPSYYGGGESEYGSGYGRPSYGSGGEGEYGSGYGRKPSYGGGGESEYGFGYGRRPSDGGGSGESEYGFGYGRKPSYGGGGENEKPSYGGGIETKYESGYGRPSNGGSGDGIESKNESGYGRPSYDGGGESEKSSYGGGIESKYESGYSRPNYGGGGDSEHGSGYGRPKPQNGSGYGGTDGEYGSDYSRPKPRYGYFSKNMRHLSRASKEIYSLIRGKKPVHGYWIDDKVDGRGESENGSGYVGRPVRKEEHSYGEEGGEGSGCGRKKKSEEYGSGGSGGSGHKKSDYVEEEMYQKPNYYGTGSGSSEGEQHNLHAQSVQQLHSHEVNAFMSRLTQDGSRGLEPPTLIKDTQAQAAQLYSNGLNAFMSRLTQNGSTGLEPPTPIKDAQPQLTHDSSSELEPSTPLKDTQVKMRQIFVEPSRDGHAESSIDMSSFSVYSDSEIMVATNSLHESSKIGKGGYGTVYIGKLHGAVVAVKMLDSNNNEGQKVFFLELVALCRMRHRNLVNLIGACFEKNALVYEFLQNGSLEDCLNKRSSFLTWKIRTRIVYDICSALKFLHSKSIVHGDLKPDNILLDANFNAKLADFGLCRFIPKGNTSGAYLQTNPKGTFAYIDLKFLETGILRPSSDLYSFGVTILKIVTGMPPLGLSRKVLDSDDNSFAKMIDPTAGSWPFEVAKELAYWGLQCCYHNEKSSLLMNDMWICLEEMLDEIDLSVPI